MKTIAKILLLCLALFPFEVSAQADIKKAFENLKKEVENDPNSQLSIDRNVFRDSKTGKIVGEYEIDSFETFSPYMNLIDDICAAFRKNEKEAYTLRNGIRSVFDSPVYMAIGEDGMSSVQIAMFPGTNYILAFFLDPDDKEGKYRHGYAIEWECDANIIKGKLYYSYTTTQKYRQDLYEKQQKSGNKTSEKSGKDSDYSNFNWNSEEYEGDWMSDFIAHINGLEMAPNDNIRRDIGAKMVKLTKLVDRYKGMTTDDKDMAIEILQTMMDSDYCKDAVVRKLLEKCIDNLKKK